MPRPHFPGINWSPEKPKRSQTPVGTTLTATEIMATVALYTYQVAMYDYIVDTTDAYYLHAWPQKVPSNKYRIVHVHATEAGNTRKEVKIGQILTEWMTNEVTFALEAQPSGLRIANVTYFRLVKLEWEWKTIEQRYRLWL